MRKSLRKGNVSVYACNYLPSRATITMKVLRCSRFLNYQLTEQYRDLGTGRVLDRAAISLSG